MLKTRRKIYLSIIAVGLVALALDRWLLSDPPGPKTAVADTELSVSEPTPPPGLQLEVVSFPDHPSRPPNTPLRDPFSLTESIRLQLISSDPQKNADQTSSGKPAVTHRNFIEDHQLSAVLRIRDVWVAVVDGTKMVRGQVLDDCELTLITAQSAHFECWDGESVLSLENPLDGLAENESRR